MRHILTVIIIFFGIAVVRGQQNQNPVQTQTSLALSYYNAHDYEKSAPLLFDVYKLSGNSTFFLYYIDCLVKLEQYDEAISRIQDEIKKQKPPKPEFYIHWGHVLKARNNTEEAVNKFNRAIELTAPDRISFLTTANTFISWGEYEYAKQTYLKGRQALPQENFHYELGRMYLYLRDYEMMMEEYLNLIRIDEKQLPRVQSALSSAMQLDIDDSLRDQFREQVLKRIQAEPAVTGYNRLLIWFFLQEKKYASALRQSVALDRRTGTEDVAIVQLGNMALRDRQYEDAYKAFDYLMGKGEANPFYRQAFALKLHARYRFFVNESPNDKEKANELAALFEEGLNFLGNNHSTLNTIQEYAHLLAFYLDRTDDAIAVLNKGLQIPRLNAEQAGLLKTEMADISIYAGDPWEATLIYSQVIEENKTNAQGDEVKLKKAKLAYYLGNFDWAKAQLDVLKASTSKLTANDAMELSLLIGNNLNLDTTAVPLTMFAKADLLFFQHKNEEAMTILDGLMKTYPHHTLVDDILMRKAKIEIEHQNYEQAAAYLERINNEFSYELLADDALFMLAEICNYNLNEKEKARDLYKEMLTRHPGSIYIEESRQKYRELRAIYPDKETEQDTREELFLDGKISPDELE